MKLRLWLAIGTLCTCPTSAFAHHLRYTANLTGAAEVLGNGSPAGGHIVVTIDFDLVTMQIATEFTALTGVVTQAHIHAPTDVVSSGTADIVTPVPSLDGFPMGGSSGSYSQEFDMNDPAAYNPAFFAASGVFPSDAFNALVNALNVGKAYFDIHTSAFPDGEIRGFLSHVEGDYNLNGVVDAADYIVWRDTFGEIGDGLVADASENSMIDADDFDAWRSNFGATGLSFAPASGTVASAAIPEPTSAILVLLALVALTVTHRQSWS